MAKNIKINYLYSAAVQVLSLLTPFITTPYLSRVLKADGIGKVSFTRSIVQYFVVVAYMGIAAYGRREISYLQDDKPGRSRVFWNLKALSLLNTSICLTVYYVLIYFYAGEDYVLYLIQSVHILNIVLEIEWLFAGMEEFKILALKGMVIRILNIALVFIFVKSREDLPVYMLINVIFIIAANAVMFPRLPKYIDPPNLKAIRPFHGIKTIIELFIPNIAIEIYTVLDKTMLGFFTTTSFENGYYESALKVSRITMMLIVSMSNVMASRIGYLFRKNDIHAIHEYMYRSYRFVWFLGIPICLGLIGISDNFVPWFFGHGYAKVAELLKITGFLVVAVGINNATGNQYLIPTKRQNLYTMTLCAGAAVNFCMNIVLIPLSGSYGASLASVIAEIVIALTQLYVLRKELNLRKIAACCKNYLIAGIIMLSVLVMTGKKLAPSPVNTFTLILSGALIYFGVLVLLRDKFFTENAFRAVDSLKRKYHR